MNNFIKINEKLLKKILYKINKISDDLGEINIMEVCGTHTNAIAKYGIKSLLPENVNLLSGPGCPVCVTSQRDIDISLYLASLDDIIFCTFGDMLKVPGSNLNTLEKMKAEGADIRIVTSPMSCINIALENKDKNVIFMAIGFETTSPSIAYTLKIAKKENIKNFFALSLNKLITPAMKVLLNDKYVKINGFILPGHVSTILGKNEFEFLKKYNKPGVITGFEAIDILLGIYMILNQIKEKDYKIEIEYKRAVKPEGNSKAREILYEVFEIGDSLWRGLGWIKNSGLKLKKIYENFDAEKNFYIPEIDVKENKSCICGDILKGKSIPNNCKLFKKVCTPFNPVGPCMVSSEGACAAFFRYG